MNLLYVGSRYHTNMVPIMRGWHENGANVRFLVQYFGAIEHHEFVELKVMKPSLLSRILFKIFEKFNNSIKAESLKNRTFVPDFKSTYKLIKEFKPDVVIIRNYRILGIVVNLICNLLSIKNVVIYTQYPIYGQWKEHGSFWGRMLMSLAPSSSFSPVFYRGKYREKEIKTGLAKYFVPLICDKPQTIRSQYCVNGKIRILDIGKYRDYKNHFFVVDAFSKVKHPENFEVTIIGQLSSKPEQDYHDRLEQYIKDKHLENIIHLRGHVGFNEMSEVYANNDVLLLASKNETAGMVILEAMAEGLCVISDYNCGLTSYIDEYKCGLSFSETQVSCLVEVLDNISDNKSIICDMGQKAQKIAKEDFCFEKYIEHLNILLKKEYGYTIPV